MEKFTAFDMGTGQVLFGGSAADPLALRSDVVGILIGQQHDSGYIADNKHHAVPEQPSPHHVFDYATKQWEDPRTLAEVKAEKRKAITARRVAEDQRFGWQGKWFQADEAAWKQITAVHGWVVARNELPPGFPGQWKAEDNTYASIPDVDAWWSFYGAAIARGAANFAHSEARKAALDACTTVAEVDDFSPW